MHTCTEFIDIANTDIGMNGQKCEFIRKIEKIKQTAKYTHKIVKPGLIKMSHFVESTQPSLVTYISCMNIEYISGFMCFLRGWIMESKMKNKYENGFWCFSKQMLFGLHLSGVILKV